MGCASVRKSEWMGRGMGCLRIQPSSQAAADVPTLGYPPLQQAERLKLGGLWGLVMPLCALARCQTRLTARFEARVTIHQTAGRQCTLQHHATDGGPSIDQLGLWL